MTQITEQKAPADYTNMEELKGAIREETLTVMCGNEDRTRLTALQERYKQLQAQWREEHAEEYAAREQRRREADARERHKEKVKTEVYRVLQETAPDLLFEFACIERDEQHGWRNAQNKSYEAIQRESTRAYEQSERANIAEAEREKADRRARAALNKFLKQEWFTTADFCQLFKIEAANARTITRALEKWWLEEYGEPHTGRWKLDREQARGFVTDYKSKRHKPHPKRIRPE